MRFGNTDNPVDVAGDQRAVATRQHVSTFGYFTPAGDLWFYVAFATPSPSATLDLRHD